MMAGEDDIEYFFLKEDDFDEVVAFLAEDYFQREPITLGTHANKKCEPGKGRMGEDVRRCLKSGLSVGARDRKSGQLIGLRVSNLLDREKPFKSTQPCNEFEELYRIAEHVVNHVYEEKADKFLMLFLLSVHKDYGARGIAGEMVKMSMEAGYSQGAQIAFTCISNVLSGKVFEKLGFKKGFALEYEKPGHDFKLDLTKMHGNKVAYLVTKELP
ncbi:arylalkylamine N-acetyltransferase 1-like [Penaeus indicus]|uniref:arylalkylamine N-acetyltransferase 1-like n=1 Tax=Penaeus indicus TaxID=29960 RepID=UPI00300C1C08